MARAKWMGAGGAAVILAIAGVLGTYHEGTRHNAYADVGGVWTICQGHTQGVRPGDTASDEQCRAYLEADMAAAYADVKRCITFPMTLAQQAAFTDAVYNIGPSVICGSTLQRLANAGDVRGACEQLLRWNKANGRVLPGLVARRQAERDLCVEGLP